ncbi:MAG TPA: LysM peptidoglycan-binding domain-containing protein [Trebonia sp.]|nr:LysM peptidoglycan-binding domain-containing protein [Trebonia sp.]
MKATVAEHEIGWEHPQAGETARGRTVPRRRRRARGAARRMPHAARSTPLRLVAAEGRVLSRASGEPVRTASAGEAEPRPPAPPPPVAPQRTPVRLTRRGRLVVTAAALLLIAAASVVLAGAAQALGHSGGAAQPARLGAGITRVQVRPGQDLWTLAEAYDPNADPRQVIQEILQLNSMSTDQVQPGQVLWMPRD